MEKKQNVFNQKRVKNLIFCICVLFIPAVQFSLFYVGVNVNSIAMAFQEYSIDSETNLGSYIFCGLENFKQIFYELKYGHEFLTAFKNSFIVFLVNVLAGTTLSLVFSLYIYKKMIFSKTFRMLLFLPSILSSIVTVTMFKNFIEWAMPEIFTSLQGKDLIMSSDTKMFMLNFFMVWIGFGTQILMYSGAMNTIEQSVIEAAKLDGVGPVREFVSIILPLIFPTVNTFLITNVAGMLTNQLNLFSFFGNDAGEPYQTVGYFLFRRTNLASNPEYPLLAAYSVVLTLIATPITLLFKRFLEKIGPTTE